MSGVIWKGKSFLDNKPIVAIFTSSSKNKKTGDIQQLWILRDDIDALTALKTGEDFSICGNCPNRGINGKKRACYVSVFRAPLKISKGYLEGRYRQKNSVDKKPIRIGAYGDPGLIPLEVIRKICKTARRWTGYTHLWRVLPSDYKQYFMASVSSEEEAKDAIKRGWRVFASIPNSSRPPKRFINCPASEEAGKTKSCDSCMMCNGGSGPNIWIYAHGIGKNFI